MRSGRPAGRRRRNRHGNQQRRLLIGATVSTGHEEDNKAILEFDGPLATNGNILNGFKNFTRPGVTCSNVRLLPETPSFLYVSFDEDLIEGDEIGWDEIPETLAIQFPQVNATARIAPEFV